ncbi:RNA-binding protein [Sphingobacteriaceae bacterium]|nr:RNA-binding protein [Sphingobacteriaceae bacterium]
MSEYILDSKQLVTESDVEMKVILPLVTNPEPLGLGFNNTQIQTKQSLRKLLIGKGDKAQLYYPDFVLNIRGVPVVVIEAKKPKEDLQEAFRQASLYAGEINRLFPSKQNPCELVLACDGIRLLAGTWDSDKPEFEIEVKNWIATEIHFSSFISCFTQSKLNKFASDFRKSIRTDVAFKNPLNLLGGKHIQNQNTRNTFGESISIQYRHLFNPNEETERRDIVKNAYVHVSKHESHVQPIDKLIRKKVKPLNETSVEIEDQVKPREILKKLENAQNYNNQVLLLIGSVGSGKSTFLTYLREVALDASITARTFWVNLNLNDAPVTASEIYRWIKQNLIKQIKSAIKADYDSLEFIEQLYEQEIASVKKGALKLLDPESEKYKSLLVERILEFQADIDLTLNCFIRKVVHDAGKELIIVLDNCDKRNLEEQLLMFEVANWIKDNIKAIVFLPIRDTTFDHYRNEKPLDTVIKDLIFRINPPSLEKVIYSRIKYANRLAEKSPEKFYTLSNGFKVSYPSSDELHYLKSILTSLFQSNFFKRLISGLAGRDIRRGIEIFLDFCKSGHITDKEILKMKQTKGEFRIPNHIISRVFLRGNLVYYSDANSRVKNLFHSDPSDDLPDPFVRLAILKLLNDLKNSKGSGGILGFHKTSFILQTLSSHGHADYRIEEELLFLIRNTLILSESQDTTKVNLDDLVSISTSGIIHLDLLKNIDYLSSCSENVWYKTVSVAEEIGNNMAGVGHFSHLAIQNSLRHSELLIKYLDTYFQDHFAFNYDIIADKDNSVPMNFGAAIKELEDFGSNFISKEHLELEKGSEHKMKIVNIQSYGVFVEIPGSPVAGYIHSSKLPADFDDVYKLGDEITGIIKAFKAEHKKYDVIIKKS